MKIKGILFATISLLLISGCSKKNKLRFGLSENMPDEYQVSKNKALEVPPHYRNSAAYEKTLENKKSKKKNSAEKAVLQDIE